MRETECHEIRDRHSGRLCGRTAGDARGQNAAGGGAEPGHGRDCQRGRGGAGHQCARAPARRLRRGDDELVGLRPDEQLHGPAPLEAAAQGIDLGPTTGRSAAIWSRSRTRSCAISRPATSRPTRRDSCLPTLQQELAARSVGVSCWGQLPQPAALSRWPAASAVQCRDAHHAAARLDRQSRGGRFPSRAGQRSAVRSDESHRRSLRLTSGQRGAAGGGQVARHQCVAVGAWQETLPARRSPQVYGQTGGR